MGPDDLITESERSTCFPEPQLISCQHVCLTYIFESVAYLLTGVLLDSMFDGAAEKTQSSFTVSVENIGGIEAVERTIQPGLTILEGHNATNRTSFLQALMAGFGSQSDQISLHSGAEEGSVTINFSDGTTDTRTLTQSGNTVQMSGEPYTENSELLDLYAFLLRENPIRRAIEQDGDLYELLMAPVDTAEIEREIERTITERDEIDQRIEAIKREQKRLPSLESTRQELEEELATLEKRQHELEEQRDELETQQPADEARERSDKLDKKLQQLERERDQIDAQIERKQAKIDGTESEIQDITVPDVDWDELEEKNSRLQAELEELSGEIREARELRSNISSGLQTAQQLRENSFSVEKALDTIDDTVELPSGPLTEPTQTAASDELTDALVEDETRRCLACGSDVPGTAIKDVIEQYKALNKGLASRIHSLEQKEATIEEEINEIEQTIQTHSEAVKRIEKAEQSIEDARQRIEQLQSNREEVTQEIDRLSSELSRIDSSSDVDETTQDYNDVRDELRSVRVDIDRTTSRLTEVNDDIETIESKVAKFDELQSRRETLASQLDELRSQVERTEIELVDQFNSTIESVLEILSYKNIERIWIERKQNGSTEDTTFVLHIVRSDGGGVYECELQHLSESERAVTGLVVALTGYLVHDVEQYCPVILLDSVEMIDSDRITALLDYLDERTEYLVVALLPEDTDAVASTKQIEHQTIVISDPSV